MESLFMHTDLYKHGEGLSSMFSSSGIGIDLGTSSILIYLKGKGVILKEPSILAVEQNSRRVLAFGQEAQKMLGRTPGNIITVKPLKEGVIADFEITEIMLRHFISRAGEKRRVFRPRVVVCIPVKTTTVEQKALLEAINGTGARDAYLLEEPRAAAIGAGLDIYKPSGNMIVDIGGGTTDIAVLSMGEIVESESIRIGGNKFDEAIARYVKKEFNVLVGERSAEKLKMEIGTADAGSMDRHMEVRGRDLVTGLPRAVNISSKQIFFALEESLQAIFVGITRVLEKTPPELSGDIMEKGIILTGGGSLLEGVDRYFAKGTGVAFYQVENPIECVVKGTGQVLENINKHSSSMLSSKNFTFSR